MLSNKSFYYSLALVLYYQSLGNDGTAICWILHLPGDQASQKRQPVLSFHLDSHGASAQHTIGGRPHRCVQQSDIWWWGSSECYSLRQFNGVRPFRLRNLCLQWQLVTALLAAWNGLSTELKAKICGFLRHHALKAVSESTLITLSESVRSCYDRWSKDISTFLETENPISKAFFVELHCEPHYTCLFCVALLLRHFEYRSEVHAIKYRFVLITFYRLTKKFQRQFCFHAHNDVLEVLVHSQLFNGLEESGLFDKLKDWKSAKARYDQIAEELEGMSSLILLPEDVSTIMWVSCSQDMSPELTLR